jgi:hypothetical protein
MKTDDTPKKLSVSGAMALELMRHKTVHFESPHWLNSSDLFVLQYSNTTELYAAGSNDSHLICTIMGARKLSESVKSKQIAA